MPPANTPIELPPITAYLDLLEPSVAQPHHQADGQHSSTPPLTQHANMQPTSVATPSEARPVRSRRDSLPPRSRAGRTPPPSSIISAIPPMNIVDLDEARSIENAVDLAQRALEEATSFARHSANRRSRERQRYQESSPPLSRRSIDERNNSAGATSNSGSSNTANAYGSRPTILRPGDRQSLYGWAPQSAQSASQEGTSSQAAQGNTTSTSSSSSFEALLRRDILPPRAPSPPRTRQAQASPANAAPGSTPPPPRPLRQFTLLGNPVSERPTTQSTSSYVSQLPPRRWQEWLDAMNGYDDDRDATPSTQPPLQPQRATPAAAAAAANRARQPSNAYLRETTRAIRKQPIEEAIKYLTRIQDKGFHWTIDEAEGLISCIYGNKVPENCLDFITDTNTLHVAPTSWLTAGSIYTGAQYATQQKPPASASFRTTQFSSLDPRINATSAGGPPVDSSSATADRKDAEEHWNVTVVIQEVDHARNRISGSMRAYDVPDWQSATGTSSINTFWEGEIIDFHTNGLETLNLPSNPRIDGNYWKKLDPFVGFSDAELAQKLTSREFLEELAENYVLMRWKEKCFVEPSSQESGLTITGFYFVSLARRTGHIEGYYYDPHSAPYQRLELTPRPLRYFPSYTFR
ncbi:hypothetical protein TWF696_003226 [Orbilia brochopaga]|uniref:Vacuolar import and degradation protein-domain-containing protein n=1 Tax=Orbilia brochopaga TaxID=3140254 RepID=A0AAV9TY56_9PEZI